jgi:hypothetical protein
VLPSPALGKLEWGFFITGDLHMNIQNRENIQSPEARKAYNLFRKEEKVRENAEAWTAYNSQKTGALQQLKRLREERLARGPVAPVVKPPAKRKSKQTTAPKEVATRAA